MIVFWRLFLTYFLTEFILGFGSTEHRRPASSRTLRLFVRGGLFFLLALVLCNGYLIMPWPFLELVDLPGWVVIILISCFCIFTGYFFNFGGKIKYGYSLSFAVKTFTNLLFLLLCSPLHVLYHTGSFFAEPWTMFFVGLILATRAAGLLLFTLEQDRYGRDFPTFDEQWMLMMARAIFFLIMLLPGYRWVVLLAVWAASCLYARKIRLLDVSNLVFYGGMSAAVLLGFLVRLRFYLEW